MKKYLLMMVVGIIVSFGIQAQNNSSAQVGMHMGKMTKKQRHKLIKDLKLTKEQKTAWKASKKDFKERQQAIKNNASLTDVQKKEQVKSLKLERLEKMRNMLTPEQIKTFQLDMQKR